MMVKHSLAKNVPKVGFSNESVFLIEGRGV